MERTTRSSAAAMPVAGAAHGRLPDFFVVGHARSGTTALYNKLSTHPRIHLGAKEPRYFATELYERDLPRNGVPTPRSLDEYRAWFAGATDEQLIGDISPDYLWSRGAAERIAEVAPQGKIVAIMREPVAFLVSLHRQLLKVFVESETDLARALELEPQRREGRELPANAFWPKATLYSERVRYVEQLRSFHERFPRERVLVLIHDDFRADNQATVDTVLDFLGLPGHHPVSARQANESVEVRSARLNDLVRRLVVPEGALGHAAKATLTALTPMRVRQRTLQATRRRLVYQEPAPPDEALVRELRRRFAPEVAALSEYLQRDLVSLWGYDNLV